MCDKTVVYLSGPMSSIENHNTAMFNSVAQELRDMGHFVINPAETGGGDHDLERSKFMKIDLTHLLTSVDMVVMLPEWTTSPGAIAEYIVAKEINLDIFMWKQEDAGSFQLKIKDVIPWIGERSEYRKTSR